AVTVGTLAAFVISRQGNGVFGLRENGLSPSPQALIALVAELVALGALLLTFLPAVGGGTVLPLRAATALAGAVAVVGIAGSALFANTATSAAAVDVADTPGSVAIAGFAFDGATTTVTAGSTITWTNADGFAHSVVARDATFQSDDLATGDTFAHTFDAPGTYAYICGIHPSMAGTVVVTG
ncbi:MAG: cupredoxin family copper-binding protein, partial [Ilumatobacteraceae bacterium]